MSEIHYNMIVGLISRMSETQGHRMKSFRIRGDRRMTDKLKRLVMEKALELVECAEKIGRQDFFEINIKHINGELITKLECTNKDRVK